jgi:hypothetical protein
MNLPELIGAKLAEPIKHAQLSENTEPVVDETSKPEIEFLYRNDNLGYSNRDIAQAREKILITKIKPAKGNYCIANNWAVVNFKGWDDKGALRFDTRELGPYNHPKVFKIG